MQLKTNDNTKFPRNSSRIRAKKTASLRKVGVRDTAIATQELLKWHEKYAAEEPLIACRELAKQQEKYTMQDP
jgi:hypothetical protein